MTNEVKAVELKLDRIRTDGGTQARKDRNEAAVHDYAQLYLQAKQEGRPCPWPPLKTVYDGENDWLYDGFHRLEGAVGAGLETVPVSRVSGDVEQAKWLACGENTGHGIRRTNKDKRN